MKLYDLVIFDVSGTLIYENAASQLVEGVPELLTRLKDEGYKLALATNYSRSSLNRFIEQYDLSELIDASVSASEAAYKPETEMLHLISLELDIPHTGMIMVGDSSSDIHMANQFSCDSLAVSWDRPFYAEVLNASPTYSAQSMEEIYEILLVS